MKMHLVFTIIVSILTVFFGLYTNWSFYIGEGELAPNRNEALVLTVIFLSVYLLYGVVMGYKKKKDFMKFIALYWGLCGVIGLICQLMLPFRGNPLKRAYAIIALPVIALTCIPTYGFSYFYPSTMNAEAIQRVQIIVSMLSSWSAGASGYLLGHLLKKIRVESTK